MPALHQVKNSAVKRKQNLTVPPDGAVHLHPVEIQAVAVIHQTAEIQAVEVLHQTAEIQVAAVLHHAVQAAEVQELIPTVPVTVRPPTVLFRKRLPVALMHSKYLVCPKPTTISNIRVIPVNHETRCLIFSESWIKSL